MDDVKLCPLKFNERTTGDPWLQKCEKENCSWWNAYYDRCCITVPTYLQGIQNRRQELRDSFK